MAGHNSAARHFLRQCWLGFHNRKSQLAWHSAMLAMHMYIPDWYWPIVYCILLYIIFYMYTGRLTPSSLCCVPALTAIECITDTVMNRRGRMSYPTNHLWICIIMIYQSTRFPRTVYPASTQGNRTSTALNFQINMHTPLVVPTYIQQQQRSAYKCTGMFIW